MFYEIKNLLTSIIVAPFEMQILAKDSELIKRLKERMEGRCLVEYGYIIKILTEGYKISDPVVQQDGCRVEIRFSAITFKPEKDDIVDFLVTVVNKEVIRGTLGHALVVIPSVKIPASNWTYKMEQNAFVDHKSKHRIEKDSKVRCKCVEIMIEMSKECLIVDHQMKIVGSLQQNDLGPI